MNWQAYYLAPDPSVWDGRKDIPADSCFFQIVKPINLLSDTIKPVSELAFALLGFKCDVGVQRDLELAGSFESPIAIRQQFAKLPIQRANIDCFDIGNIVCVDDNLEASLNALAQVIRDLLAKNIRPIVIGGGHELAFGHYQGLAQFYPQNKKLGILNFDAHFNLQPSELITARSAFYKIAEDHQHQRKHFNYNCIGIQHTSNIRQQFELAKKFAVQMILADEIHQGLQEKSFDFIERMIDENEIIYMSISMDVFSSAFAPGVCSIQPLGLTPWQVIPLIRLLSTSGKVVSYDIANFIPRYDIDHRTAKLAAMLIYEIIHHHNEHPMPW